MQKTFEIIDSCSAFVIDLSEKGVGLGIEASYAHARGIPVVVAKAGADISDTLRGIAARVFSYGELPEVDSFLPNPLPADFTPNPKELT